MKEDAGDDDRDKEKSQDMKLWGVFLFGLIGATASKFAVSSNHSFYSIPLQLCYNFFFLYFFLLGDLMVCIVNFLPMIPIQ